MSLLDDNEIGCMSFSEIKDLAEENEQLKLRIEELESQIVTLANIRGYE